MTEPSRPSRAGTEVPAYVNQVPRWGLGWINGLRSMNSVVGYRGYYHTARVIDR